MRFFFSNFVLHGKGRYFSSSWFEIIKLGKIVDLELNFKKFQKFALKNESFFTKFLTKVPQKQLKLKNLKETCNSFFCVTPKNHWLMFVS